MKPKKYCEYCKFLGQYPNGKKRCERTKYVQPFIEREQEACEKFEKANVTDNDDFNSCGNCWYMELDFGTCYCHKHRVEENGDSFATECPEAFTCDDWLANDK